ncbi:MAG: hypothetical protein VB104_09965 [Candidatus Limiplasma sp.]|nr:hypothetical protein [Candidatus Limiplasma sp.]
MSYYLLAIGGTGNKILEALVYACAADALYTLDEDHHRTPLPAVHALIVDVDAACGNTTRAKQAAEKYETVRAAFAAARAPHRGFHTALDVSRWNMNLAKRASSIAGMTQNHRRDRMLAESLFSRTEAELEYSEGFRGHPDLGVLFFADLLNNLDTLAAEGQPDEMLALLTRMRAELDAGETVSVMLAGSIFGGTGASGIPSISRFLRERFRDRADRFVLSATLMLPYYEVPPATADETLEIVVKSSTFLDKARTALQYYGMEGMIRSGEDDPRGVYDALYLLGLPREAFVTARLYSTGSQSQENDAHLLEWLAVRCAAQFYRTGFRGAQAHNIDCYYYQWHSHEVSWDCFEPEGAFYRTAFGGLLKAAALFFAECYPTLRACVQEDARREVRVVNYVSPYFFDLPRWNAAQRAQLEKRLDALYRLLAFYTNWMWQVLRTLPPTLRPESADEAGARELAEVYRNLVDVRAMAQALDAAAAPDTAQTARREELHAQYRELSDRLTALITALGGHAFLRALDAERAFRTERAETQRLALEEQAAQIALWEGEDADRVDPATLRQEKTRLAAMDRALQGFEERLALVQADTVRAVEDRVAAAPPQATADALPPNQLFNAAALETLHTLLTLYGSDAETRDPRAVEACRRALWGGLQHLVCQRVPDRVGAVQAVAGLGGGARVGEGPEAAFASFTAALLSAVVEEENL